MMEIAPRDLIKKAQEAFGRLVQPSLIAMYASHSRRPESPEQVATGFLVSYGGRPVLVTAKHSLRGENFDQDPGEKAVFLDGHWVYLGDGNREVVQSTERDIALAYFDEFPLDRCLPQTSLDPTPPPVLIAIGGFLLRDFKRPKPQLRPAPHSYINTALASKDGLIRMKYPKRLNVSLSGEAVVNPRPEGLSGGPMLDAIALTKNQVRLVGVFTERDPGTAIGEDIEFVRRALKSLWPSYG